MLVAEHGGDTMLPRIGIMRALHARRPEPRQKAANKYRIMRGGYSWGTSAVPRITALSSKWTRAMRVLATAQVIRAFRLALRGLL